LRYRSRQPVCRVKPETIAVSNRSLFVTDL
jgi:hypothetical protein